MYFSASYVWLRGSTGSVCHPFCFLLQKQSWPLGEVLDVSKRKVVHVKNTSFGEAEVHNKEDIEKLKSGWKGYKEMPNQKKKDHFFKTKRILGQSRP